MKTIEENDAEVRKNFNKTRRTIVKVSKRLEALGLRVEDSQQYLEDNEAIYIKRHTLDDLQTLLHILRPVFGAYKLSGIWNGYSDVMIAAYRFERMSDVVHVWLESPAETFPIEAFSPGCKITERAERPSYVVECPVRIAGEVHA